MGRKPLKDDYVQQLVHAAKSVGVIGLTRKQALELGAVSEARWTLIKNKAVKEGRLIRVGWKKSARYYAPGYEPQDDPSHERVIVDVEEELDEVLELLDETPVVEPLPITTHETQEEDISIDWNFDF